MNRLSRIFASAMITLLISGIFFIAVPVHAVSTTLEIVNPLNGTHEFNFTTAEKSVGDTFVVNITITNIANLFSWQVGIQWDPTLLQFVSMVYPSDHIFAPQGPLVAGPDSTVPGKVVYSVSAPAGGSSFNGTGRLAQLTLKIIKAVYSSGPRRVDCNITFEGLGVDTFLLDKNSLDIPYTPVDGHFSYSAPYIPPPPAKLYISPPRVVDPTLIPGSAFTVNLTLSNATDVHSWSAKVLYVNSILNATNVVEGSFLSSVNATTFSSTIQYGYNATHDMIQMSCSLSEGGANGKGELATMTFQVLAFGQSPIAILDPDLRDSLDTLLPFTKTDGYFNNVLIGRLSIDPSEVTGPGYVPGATFAINVTLDDVENLKTCIFNLTYISSVIQEININIPSVLGQIPVKKLQVDDDAGYIWTNITYRNGITTYEPVTIMTVEFTVVAMGVSPINLTDTQLFDIGNQPITHEVSHGIFIGLIRDVAVLNVQPDLHMAYQGWIVYINVTVKNKGNLTETFDVHFYYDSNLGNTTTVLGLAPDEERIMPLKWNTSTVQPCHNYSISATADPVPYEMNLADNSLTDGNVKIRWMGDVNGDGRVDMRDINQCVQGFRTYPGHQNWNPDNDLDRSSMVDMRDILICVINFNKACP